MSVVEHYDRFKKYNPSSIAEALAKARAAEEPTSAPATGEASAKNTANRSARAAAINAASGVGGGEKRKAEEQDSEDVEMGDDNADSADVPASKVQRTV